MPSRQPCAGSSRRSRTVAFPRWAYVLLGARGVIQPLLEPFMARNAEEPCEC